MFVLSGGHGEHRFDSPLGLLGLLWPHRRFLPNGASVAVTWAELAPATRPLAGGEGQSGLRLVDVDPVAAGTARRRVPLEVRRRRTLFAVMAGLVLALALPLSGTGGHSHPTGSARAEAVAPGVYTVQPGDSLWSIAERLEPSADPRPLVVQLAAQTGSETVVPGERIDLP